MFTSSDSLDEVICVRSPSIVDAIVDPGGTLAWAAIADPGPDVAACLAVIDPADLPRAAQLDLVVAAQRLIAWSTSLRAQALAALAGRASELADPVDVSGEHWTADEVRCALRVSEPSAKDLIDEGRQLTAELAPTMSLLATGQIDPHHVTVLRQVGVAHRDTPGLLDALQRKVLPRAVEQTPGELRRSASRAVLRLAPKTLEQAHHDALADRRVVCTARGDGMSDLYALLPADVAAAFMTALSAVAGDYCPEDGRTVDQRRADAMADLAGGVLSSSTLPTHHGVKPVVQVTVALSTLLGDDQQPGELDGYGPIPASLAVKIASDPNSVWRRLVVDEVGELIDYGRTTYRPPKDLTDFVIARDRECRFPTCHRPARLSDLDHAVEWQDDGTTSADNLGAMCPRHHDAKTRRLWTIAPGSAGATVWTDAATGHRFTNRPDPLPVPSCTTPAKEPDPPPPF